MIKNETMTKEADPIGESPCGHFSLGCCKKQGRGRDKMKENKIRIRRMTEDDIPQAVEIENMCFSEPWSEGSYRSCFAGDGTQSWFYVAVREEEPEKLLGMIGLTRMGEDGEISNVAVRPENRGNGIARMLLEKVLEDGREGCGLRDFTLEVRVGNEAANRLYEAEGFREEGVRPGFYRNPEEDARIMWKRFL